MLNLIVAVALIIGVVALIKFVCWILWVAEGARAFDRMESEQEESTLKMLYGGTPQEQIEYFRGRIEQIDRCLAWEIRDDGDFEERDGERKTISRSDHTLISNEREFCRYALKELLAGRRLVKIIRKIKRSPDPQKLVKSG